MVLVVKSTGATNKIPSELGIIYSFENDFGIKDSADTDLIMIAGFTLQFVERYILVSRDHFVYSLRARLMKEKKECIVYEFWNLRIRNNLVLYCLLLLSK